MGWIHFTLAVLHVSSELWIEPSSSMLKFILFGYYRNATEAILWDHQDGLLEFMAGCWHVLCDRWRSRLLEIGSPGPCPGFLRHGMEMKQLEATWSNWSNYTRKESNQHAGDWLAEIALWVQWRQGWQTSFFCTDGLQVARDGIFDKREGPRLVGTVELCLPRSPVMRVHPVDVYWSNVAVKSAKHIMYYDYTVDILFVCTVQLYYMYIIIIIYTIYIS